MTHHQDHTTALSTVAGTTLSVIGNIDSQQYGETVVLAILGAVVSFGVSVCLKWIWNKLNN